MRLFILLLLFSFNLKAQDNFDEYEFKLYKTSEEIVPVAAGAMTPA